MGAEVNEVEPPLQDVPSYIADMLAELADMAAGQGDAGLEAVIRIAAIHAERSRRNTGRA